ncbi:MAG: DUF87 domain-containing protein [Myxococcota bacterium]
MSNSEQNSNTGSNDLLGRHIAVWGTTGSGKSTLGAHLSASLGLARVELDGLRHARGWDSVGYPEMAKQLEARLDAATNGWVIDGNYRKVHSAYLARIDTLILLRYPLRVTFPQLLKRTLLRSLTGRELYGPGGPRERLSTQLFGRDSLLLYAIVTHRQKSEKLLRLARAQPEHVRLHIVTTPRALTELLSRAGVPFIAAQSRG